MAIQLDAKHTLDRLSRDLELTPQDTMRAGVGAINGSIRTTIAYAARVLGRSYTGLKIGSIKRQIRAEWASPKQQEIKGAVEFTRKRFRLLSNFRATQTRRGVRLGRGGPWRVETLDGQTVPPAALAHAFIQRARRGGEQVWIRVGQKRYPITALLAPSLAVTVSEDGKNLMPFVLATAAERFTTVFGQRAKFLAAKREGLL